MARDPLVTRPFRLSHPHRILESVGADRTTSLEFAEAARRLGLAARAAGLVVPGFRSPPRIGGTARSIRRPIGRPPVVAVALHGRPVASVVADMIDGIVVANDGRGVAAAQFRDDAWAAVVDLVASDPAETSRHLTAA